MGTTLMVCLALYAAGALLTLEAMAAGIRNKPSIVAKHGRASAYIAALAITLIWPLTLAFAFCGKEANRRGR